jgi:4-amino-4-deoxy-L-arabinose transferase-like glycosyltransferase
MVCYALCGVHDWAARLVPALCGVGTVLAVSLWARRAFGPWTAAASGLLLCLSPRFLYLARMLTLDGLLCLCVTVALAAAHRAVCEERLRWRWWLASAAAAALGVLCKGPVALVLVAVPVALFQLLDRRCCRPSLSAYLAYAAVVAGLAGPWFLAAALHQPDAAAHFFWQHNLQRYVDPLDHAKPFWYYLPDLLLGTLPWSLLLFPAARWITRRSRRTALRRSPALGFALLVFLWCLLFFSCSGCKRPGYVLPALPFLAVVLGAFLGNTVSWKVPGRSACRFRIFQRQARLAQAALLTTVLLALAGSVLAAATGLVSPAAGYTLAGVLLLALVLLLRKGPCAAPAAAWGVCAAAMFLLLWVAVQELQPAYNRKFGLRGVVRRHVEVVEAQRLPVLCYPHRWDSVSFYLRGQDVHAFGPQQRESLRNLLGTWRRALVFVKSDHSLAELKEALPASLEFVEVGRRGWFVTVGVVRPRGRGG